MPRQITQCPQCEQPIALYDSLLGDYPAVLECPTCGWQKEDSKQWGGPGRGQGKKSTWQSGPTKPIKVPIALADEVMHYARALDRGELPGRSPSPWSQLGDVLSSLSTPADSPALAPADSPALAPADSPALAPADSPALAPADSPALAPADSPALAPEKLSEAIALLGEALGLKANAGGAIKVKIREALELLADDN